MKHFFTIPLLLFFCITLQAQTHKDSLVANLNVRAIPPAQNTSIIMQLTKSNKAKSSKLTGAITLAGNELNDIKSGKLQLKITIPKNILIGKKYMLAKSNHAFSLMHSTITIEQNLLSKLSSNSSLELDITSKHGNEIAGHISIKLQPQDTSPQKSNNTSGPSPSPASSVSPSGQSFSNSAIGDQRYITKNYLRLQTCDLNGNPNSDTVLIKKGILFTREKAITTTIKSKAKPNEDSLIVSYVVHILNWPVAEPNYLPIRKKRNLKKNKEYVYDDATDYNGSKYPKNWDIVPKFFILEASDTQYTQIAPPLDTLSKVTFTNFNIQSLPAKLRFGSDRTLHYPDDNNSYRRRFDVSGSLSIGAAYGPRFSLDHGKGNYFLSILGGFSVGTVSIDSSSTDNKSGSTKTDAALTPYGGVIFEYKTFQLGVLTGIDFLTGDIGRNWNYRNQPWLGIGIGISIFSNTNNSNGQTGTGTGSGTAKN